MVDQETGLRGFQLTGREEFLRPFEDGRRAFIAALVDARRYAARDDRAVRAELDRSEQISRRWLSQAEHAVELRRGGARTVAIEPITRRKHLMDSIRASDARLQHLLDRRRDSQLARSGRDAVIVILLLSALFGVAGYVLVWRGGRAGAARDSAERRYRDSQAHFADTTQIVDSEAEAHDLVQRHLEHSVPGSRVVVLRRNNSADRLQAVTEIGDGSAVVDGLLDAAPRSCLAVRLGQRFER
ncbi:MAG TPA: CHASE3 domain-containing protein, partial [Solirubrobacteraceae bacterium]